MTSVDDVKKLREMTGCGIGDCQKALTEAAGDFDVARKKLQERGAEMLEKKSERMTNQGIIETYTHGAGKIGVMLEIRCETDFVARNEEFKVLAHDIALHIIALNPQSVEGLLSQEYVKDSSLTIKNLIDKAVAKFGENIKIEKFVRYEL